MNPKQARNRSVRAVSPANEKRGESVRGNRQANLEAFADHPFGKYADRADSTRGARREAQRISSHVNERQRESR
jgi:hypothetical protein